MDFRDSLADETSASLRHVLNGQAEHTLRGLEAFRTALHGALGALDSAIGAAAEDQHEAEISALVDRLAAATKAQAQASADLVRAEADQLLAASEAKRADAEQRFAESARLQEDTRQQLGDAGGKIQALLSTIEDRRRRHEALVTSVGDLQAHADALQAEIEAERARTASALQEVAAATSARLQAEGAVQEADAARRQHEHARKALERELLDVRSSLDRVRSDSATLTARLDAEAAERASLEAAIGDALARIEGTEAERDQLTRQIEEGAAERERLTQTMRQLEGVRRELQVRLEAAAEREGNLRDRLAGAEVEASEARAHVDSMARAAAAPAPVLVTRRPSLDFAQLIAAYQELEGGTSITAVLTAFTKGLSGQFARVALFGVNGNALQGSYQLGFDINKDITKIVMPMTMESVLTRAFSSGQIETMASDHPTDRIGVPFGGASDWGMALPVALRGEIVAVVYADHGEHAPASAELEASRLAFAELLWRHAVPVLTKLTFDLRAWAELRDYAGLLLDELEYIYSADANAGKQSAELVEGLTGNLRCAQEAYARRLESAAASDAGSDLFEEKLSAILDAKGATAFGRHLSVAAAALSASRSTLDASTSQPAAQAS